MRIVSSWGHRNTCFALFNNDYGSTSSEGFIGVGLATGGPYTLGSSWPVAALICFDFVDPCSSSALPVELTSFTANLIGSNVELSWQTATELNNYGFEIERQKSELNSENSAWEKIGFVNGNGNSNSPNVYSYH